MNGQSTRCLGESQRAAEVRLQPGEASQFLFCKEPTFQALSALLHLQLSHASSPSLKSRRRPQGVIRQLYHYTARLCWPSQHDFYRNKHIKCTRNIQGRFRDLEMNSRLRIDPLGLGRGCFPGSTTLLLKSIFVVLVSTPALQSLHCGVQPLGCS